MYWTIAIVTTTISRKKMVATEIPMEVKAIRLRMIIIIIIMIEVGTQLTPITLIL